MKMSHVFGRYLPFFPLKRDIGICRALGNGGVVGTVLPAWHDVVVMFYNLDSRSGRLDVQRL